MDIRYEDEDFKALVEARRKRTNTTEDDDITLEQRSADIQNYSQDVDKIRQSTDNASQDIKLQLHYDNLRTELFKAADFDDATKCQYIADRVTRPGYKFKDKKFRKTRDDSMVFNNKTYFDVSSPETGFFEADVLDDKTRTTMKAVAKQGLTFSDEELRRKEDNMTVLHYALENERWNVAKYFITKGSEKLLTDEYNITVDKIISGKSCLHILAEKGNLELTKLFLQRLTIDAKKKELYKTVTQMESQKPRKLSCMHLASLNGFTNLIELFHQHGVGINIRNNKKESPVLLAVRGNHIETVRKLIQLGADLEQKDDEGSTPLYCAVRCGLADLVKILLNEGNVNVRHQRQRGFFSPLGLASALGYHGIVEILLENGADANVRINNGQTALHVAATEGNNKVIKVLLEKGKVDINHADNQGNPALLLAAKAGNIIAMQLFVEVGADIDRKNKIGKTIWDHAIHQPKIEFLKAVTQLYRRAKGFDVGKLTFVEGINPLHAAASNGDVEKMRYLLEICEDPKARDQSGNTFFHVAARDGSNEIIETFMSEVDVNDKNNDGDTALHMACKSGHVQTTQVLLHEAKLEAKNDHGMTPLHVAVASDAVSPELIRIFVERIDKADWWQLNAVDKDGNTALHIAAKHRNTEILSELRSLDPNIENHEGDTPFHVAAASGIYLDTMIEIFHNPKKGVNIDQRDLYGKSCLHVCARRGNVHSLRILVDCGADLELRDWYGNTIAHAVIEESVQKPEKKEALLEVFRGITRVATLWWCKKEKLKYPNEDTDEYHDLLRTAMLHLTSKVYNKDGLNAVEYAIKKKAVDMLQEILNTPHVYKFMEEEFSLFDITDLIPETTCDEQRQNVFMEKCSKAEEKNGNEVKKQRTGKSYLGLILDLNNDDIISKILDINPFKQLMRNPYKFFYVAFMLIHIVYMSLFSVYVFPSTDDLYIRYNSTAVSDCQSCGINWVYGLFLIWPGLILLYEICLIYFKALDHRKRLKKVAETEYYPYREEDMKGSYLLWKCFRVLYDRTYEYKDCVSNCFLILNVIYKYLSNIEHLLSLAFSGLAIAWYVLFQCPPDMSTYVEIVSMVFAVGWLYTITFTKGFEGMHSYNIMLKRIIKRDITRYFFMYIFFLLGCGMAFSALFQIVPSTRCSDSSYFHASIWITLFNVFSLMLGLGSLFDDSFDDCYTTYGGNPTFVRCLFVFYIICTTIILMNLLISMMSDTYRNIKEAEETIWKLGSLRLALRIERLFPKFIKRLRQRTHIDRDRIFKNNIGRWMIKIQHDKIQPLKGEWAQDELLITVERLEKVCAVLSMQSNGAVSSNAPMTKRSQSLFHQIRRMTAVTRLISQTKK